VRSQTIVDPATWQRRDQYRLRVEQLAGKVRDISKVLDVIRSVPSRPLYWR
jgi:hypothetical protein